MLDRLRRETRPHHEHIERNARMRRLLASDLKLGEYAALIRDQAAFYRPLETALADRPEWTAHGFDLRPRRKTPLLERDLAYLSARCTVSDAAAVAPTPAVADFSAAVGCLYVLEGATLGGRLIARHLRDTLGLTPDTGLAFYTAYGKDHGRMWRAFRAAVEAWDADGALDPETTVAAARATFSGLDAWLTPLAPQVA